MALANLFVSSLAVSDSVSHYSFFSVSSFCSLPNKATKSSIMTTTFPGLTVLPCEAKAMIETRIFLLLLLLRRGLESVLLYQELHHH